MLELTSLLIFLAVSETVILITKKKMIRKNDVSNKYNAAFKINF